MWDSFVSHAKNATFLFQRDFMEYHQDHFQDFSLMVFEKESLVGLFPANINDQLVYSHQGLTYGSLILTNKTSACKVFQVFESICDFLKSHHIKEVHIKQVPEIYFKKPAFELGYILAKKASLVKREMVLAIDYSKPLKIHKTKLKHFRKAKDLNVIIKKEDDFSAFWEDVLKPRLLIKHNAKPVHTCEEISLLQRRFPERIKQYNAYSKDKLLAGITVFETDITVKSQYGATTKEGEKFRALDYLFLFLIEKYKTKGKQFFSMGTVGEQNEMGFNKGLLKQKEELGCCVYLQDFFRLKLDD